MQTPSTISTLRYVKVARWERPDSGELDGELYNNGLKQLPHKMDRIKQNAIYVDIQRMAGLSPDAAFARVQ